MFNFRLDWTKFLWRCVWCREWELLMVLWSSWTSLSDTTASSSWWRDLSLARTCLISSQRKQFWRNNWQETFSVRWAAAAEHNLLYFSPVSWQSATLANQYLSLSGMSSFGNLWNMWHVLHLWNPPPLPDRETHKASIFNRLLPHISTHFVFLHIFKG